MVRRGGAPEVGGEMVDRLDYDTAVRETNRNPMGGLSGSIAAMFSMGAKKATDILKAEYTRVTRKANEEEREALRKAILNKAKQQILKQLQDTEIKKLQALKDQQAREKAAYKLNADNLKAQMESLQSQQKEAEAKLANTRDPAKQQILQNKIERLKQDILAQAKKQRELDAKENARSARAEANIAKQQQALHTAVQQAVDGINKTYGLQEDIAVDINQLGISSSADNLSALETRAATAERDLTTAQETRFAAPKPDRTASRDDRQANPRITSTREPQPQFRGEQRRVSQGDRPQQGTAPVQVTTPLDYEKLAEAILHAIREARKDTQPLQTTPPSISVTSPEPQVIDVVPEPIPPQADTHDESYALLEAKTQANEAQDIQQRQEARQNTQDGLTDSFRKQLLAKVTQQIETLDTIQDDLTHIHSAVQEAGLADGGGLDLGLGDLLDFKNLKGGAGNLLSKGKGLLGNAAKGLTRLAPWAILAGGAYGGITSATDTDAIMAQKGYTDPSQIELADKIHHGLSGMLSGMSFGLIDTDTIANFTERAGNFITGGGFVTKKEQKEQLAAQEQQSWAEIDAMIASRTQPQGQVQTTDGTYSSDNNSVHSQILQEMGVAPAHNESKAQELTELNEGMTGVMNSSVSNVTNNNTTNVIPESPRYRISDSTTLALAMQGL